MNPNSYATAAWGTGANPVTDITIEPVRTFLCPSDATLTGNVRMITNHNSNLYLGIGLTWNYSTGLGMKGPFGANYGAMMTITGSSTEGGVSTTAAGGKYAFRTNGGLPLQYQPISAYQDGTSSTVQVVELYRGKTFTTSSGNKCFSWATEVGFCGASATRVPNDDRADTVTQTTTTNSPMNFLFTAYNIPASSTHAGGANALYADGSVHFISELIDLNLWQNTCSFDGGEKDVYLPDGP